MLGCLWDKGRIAFRLQKKIETKLKSLYIPGNFQSLVSPLCYPLSVFFCPLFFLSGLISSVSQSASGKHTTTHLCDISWLGQVLLFPLPPITPVIISSLSNFSSNLTEGFWVIQYRRSFIFIVTTRHFKSKPGIYDVKFDLRMGLYIWNYDCPWISGWFGLLFHHFWRIIYSSTFHRVLSSSPFLLVYLSPIC